MTKIQFTGRQYIVTIGHEHIRRMNWERGTDVYIAKDPGNDRLYIEEMPGKNRRKSK